MNYFVFFLFLALIVADCLTGRKNNQLTVILNILAAGAIPALPFLFPERLAPYFIIQILVVEYLCLRLMIAKYRFLRQEGTDKLSVKGAGALTGYAILYNIVTFVPALAGLTAVIGGVAWAGGAFTAFIGVPSLLIAIAALFSGDFAAFLETLGMGAATGAMAFLIVSLLLLLIGIFSLLFLAVPFVLGIRGLKNCFRELKLSKVQIAGYAVFLLFPYFNTIPLVKLRGKCRRCHSQSFPFA